MPIKLSVGLCRKQGLPDYGSVGASCHLEVELPADILGGAGTPLQRQAEIAFDACRDAVARELARYATSDRRSPHSCTGESPPVRNRHSSVDSNAAARTSPRRATASQVRAIETIARRQDRDLPELLQKRYGLGDPAELSIAQASELIDSLKDAAPSAGARR